MSCPDAYVSSTKRRLNAASCVRRVANFGDGEALFCTRFMVCTIIDSAHHHGEHRVRACLLTRSIGRRPPDDAYALTTDGGFSFSHASMLERALAERSRKASLL